MYCSTPSCDKSPTWLRMNFYPASWQSVLLALLTWVRNLVLKEKEGRYTINFSQLPFSRRLQPWNFVSSLSQKCFRWVFQTKNVLAKSGIEGKRSNLWVNLADVKLSEGAFCDDLLITTGHMPQKASSQFSQSYGCALASVPTQANHTETPCTVPLQRLPAMHEIIQPNHAPTLVSTKPLILRTALHTIDKIREGIESSLR